MKWDSQRHGWAVYIQVCATGACRLVDIWVSTCTYRSYASQSRVPAGPPTGNSLESERPRKAGQWQLRSEELRRAQSRRKECSSPVNLSCLFAGIEIILLVYLTARQTAIRGQKLPHMRRPRSYCCLHELASKTRQVAHTVFGWAAGRLQDGRKNDNLGPSETAYRKRQCPAVS